MRIEDIILLKIYTNQFLYFQQRINEFIKIRKCSLFIIFYLMIFNFPLILLFTALTCKSESISRDFTINQKYSYSGKANIVLTASSGYTRQDITVPFPQPYSNYMQAIIAIGDLQLSNSSNYIYIYTQVPQITGTSISLYASIYSNVIQLKLNYFVYSILQYNQYSIYSFQNYVGISQYVYKNSQITAEIYKPMSEFSSFDGARVLTFISGIHASSTDSFLTYSIDLTAGIKSSTSILLTIGSASSTPTLFYVIEVSFLVYIPAYVNSKNSLYYNLYSGKVAFEETNIGSFSNSAYPMTSINAFIGLSSFAFSSLNPLSFSTSIDNNTAMFTSAYSLNQFSFTFFSFYSNYCSYKTPFYEAVTHQCYSGCPGSSIPDNSSISCLCYVNNTRVDNSNCVQITPSNTGTIIGFTVGATILCLLICSIAFVAFRKYRSWKDEEKQVKYSVPDMTVINLNDAKVSEPIKQMQLKQENRRDTSIAEPDILN